MDLAALRRIYARQMLAAADACEDARLEDAFASVSRERFLGQGEWQISTPWSPSVTLPQSDPVLIYQDVVVALDRDRGVNNGSPSLHAHWMHAVAPRSGETVAHIGAGAGYYTALLSELVGKAGRVTAVEFDADLAARASTNLRDRSNVEVVCADGHDWPREPADIVYVNFAVSRPASAWVENLRLGGRLIFSVGVPQTKPEARGRHASAVTVMVTRREEGYAAQVLGRVTFVFAEGTKSAVSEADLRTLEESLETKGWEDVRSLVWRSRPAPARCWYAGSDWGLSFDELRRSEPSE